MCTEGPWNVCLAGTWESGDLEEMEKLRGEGGDKIGPDAPSLRGFSLSGPGDQKVSP